MKLTVEKVIFGGKGLSRDLGKTVFVDGALAGEVVEAEVTAEKKNYLEAKVTQVVTSSPERVEAPCRHYGWCGGCQYQHMSYSEERRVKNEQVREILGSFASSTKVILPIQYSPKDYGYRNSVTFHQTEDKRKKKSQIGFIGIDNKTIIPVAECLLLDPALSAVWAKSGRTVFKDQKLTFKLAENREIISDQDERFFRIQISGISLITSSKGFFQNNLDVTALLTNLVSDWIRNARPQLFLDLYSGMGLFSLLCASEVPEIYCVEENGPSLEALKMNLEEKKRTGVHIRAGRVEKIYTSIVKERPISGSVVLLDPPRQGLEKSLASALAHSEAERIIYISCDLPSLARDLAFILSAGRYQVEQIVPFDMFPRTKHIEAAVLLTSKTSSSNLRP